MYSLTNMIFTKSVSDEGEGEKQDVGSLKLGQPLRGNRKWKVEKQRTLRYFINLPKDGPVCPDLRATLLRGASVLPMPSGRQLCLA